jgi:hypothetical protein
LGAEIASETILSGKTAHLTLSPIPHFAAAIDFAEKLPDFEVKVILRRNIVVGHSLKQRHRFRQEALAVIRPVPMVGSVIFGCAATSHNSSV